VLAELWRLTAGTVLVSHNLDFEQRFLAQESRRAGLPVPAMLALCTLRTARVQLDGRTFKLKPLYKTATGQWPADEHTALADARATAAVLCWMLAKAPGGLHLQDWPPPPPDPRYASVQPGRIAPRPSPARSNELADFIQRFPRSRARRPTAPGAESRYLQLLAAVVADERISLEEAAALEACARTGGLTQIPLEELHRQAFFRVLGEEVHIPPAALSVIRRRELLGLARALGVSQGVEILAPLVDADLAAARKPAGTGYLKGWRIGLDPADDPGLDHLRDLAGQHDASIAKKLTKTVRFLATTTAGTPAQAKASELGIPIITPHEAHRILDEAIRTADLAAFEHREAQAEWEAELAERDRYWRHTWKRTEDPSAANGPWPG
jgi:DNA polymerase-3 subunit epsilon